VAAKDESAIRIASDTLDRLIAPHGCNLPNRITLSFLYTIEINLVY
jgi:hypothetical protein